MRDGMPEAALPVETFPALDALPGVRAAFLTRVPGVAVDVERAEALDRLRPVHARLLNDLGFAAPALAEQIHGSLVTAVTGPVIAPGADGLATDTPGLTLGIYVADCAAIYVVDPVRRAIALLHSGRKGTEANILARGVECLHARHGSVPADLVVVVSPCIRPPFYEVDFAATLAAQARALGVGHYHDAGTCTASDPDRYYSYRRERGHTGRMLALLMLSCAKLEDGS